jgi:hypothetical protein
MAWHWVKATKVIKRERDGVRETFQPGDWLQVQPRDLLRYQAEGKIKTPGDILKATFDFSHAGVLRLGNTPILPLGDFGLQQEAGDYPALPWKYTLITARMAVNVQNAALGFLRVEERTGYDAWELAAQLKSGYPLAESAGTPEERALTLATLGDLRIPMYDTSLLWVRRTEATLDLIGAWTEELKAGADRDQAFLRALYTRRVLLATLPPEWVGAQVCPQI